MHAQTQRPAAKVLTPLAEVEAGTHPQGSTCSSPISALWAGKAVLVLGQGGAQGPEEDQLPLALELGSEDMLLPSLLPPRAC